MECVHCKKTFSADAFDAHCREHAEIQTRLKRSGTRTYGARYDSKDADSQDLPSEAPAKQEQNSGSRTSTNVRPSVGPSVEASQSNRNVLDGLDKRIHSIIENFPPYGGDGVETPWPETVDFKCKDCSFKFRTKKECDEHYLSKYCDGASIVMYCLIMDESRPCGYRMEKDIQPLDGAKDPSLFQCQKCSSTFPTEMKMEDHQKTHLLSPSRCLHCQKMFSTKYELEDHYEWHDDMDYRQKIDGLGINSTSHETDELKEPKDMKDNISSLTSGIQNMSLPSQADKGKTEKLPSGSLGGISFISAEDIERAVAPNGYFQGTPTTYMQADADGTPIGEPIDAPWSSGPTLPILGHGKPGYILAGDVAGRKRWMRKARVIINRLAILDEVKAQLEASVSLPENDLHKIMHSRIAALEMLNRKDLDGNEELKFLALVNIAGLARDLNMFEVGVEYYLRALELSVKQYSKDSINNFQLINSLGVLFDTQNMHKEAGYLYRRSLLGRINIHGFNHADTLMSMQELANVNQKLGNLNASRSLLEQAYIGSENLEKTDEQFTMGVLNNLAATYSLLGKAPEAIDILKLAIPRMRDSLGLRSTATCGAICNLLQFTKGNEVAAEVHNIIRDMQEDITEPGSTAVGKLNFPIAKRPVPVSGVHGYGVNVQCQEKPAAGRVDELGFGQTWQMSVWEEHKEALLMLPYGALLLNKLPTDERRAQKLLSLRHARTFASDPNITGVVKLVSSEAFFVNPTCFATFRVWKDPTKLVGYYFANADTRVTFSNRGEEDWLSAHRMGTAHLYPSPDGDPVYLLVAPGKKMFRSAKNEWTRTTGINADIDFPNSSMIEYLQSEEPQSIQMQLAVIITVWEV
ncbi:hypothetical protein O988_07360 [Pseudogymnoascus sp. VKM F-3808]|nr:hypothetical protein O988_07360 [Pseudogymnoascus sp. VKM F-3808]